MEFEDEVFLLVLQHKELKKKNGKKSSGYISY